MHDDPIVLPSAEKHGVSEESALHALTHHVDSYVQEDGMTMYVGPDFDGTLIEVGLITWYGETAIVHADRPARDKYLR